MATTKLYLDTRGKDDNEPAPLKVCITSHGKSTYIGLDIKLSKLQWNAETQKVKNVPNGKLLSSYINNRKLRIDNAILELAAHGELRGLTIIQIKKKIQEYISPSAKDENLFIARFKKFGESRTAERTREIYATTLKKILDYDKSSSSLSFEQITKEWLTGFDAYLQRQGLVRNSRNIHLRNIRAVFNDAIDNEITSHYPLRKFNISTEETAKRSLSVEELRKLFSCNVEKWQQRYLDYFKLTFFLIGINPVDLCSCTDDNVDKGRLVYKRHKTGRMYNIKIENEALSIINRYKGKKLLVNFTERMTNYKTFVGKANKAYKKIGDVIKVENKEKTAHNRKFSYHINYRPYFPGLSIYWARHTWATIAFSIGIPEEIIAEALGHSHGNRTTAIYIDKSVANIDAANRKVIDYVLNSSHEDNIIKQES
jgi:integrase